MLLLALQRGEKAIGPEYTLALITVNNLGARYKDQGSLSEAEKMYKQVLYCSSIIGFPSANYERKRRTR